jgi:hypothetical protein
LPSRIARYCTRERCVTVDSVGGSIGRAEQITALDPHIAPTRSAFSDFFAPRQFLPVRFRQKTASYK